MNIRTSNYKRINYWKLSIVKISILVILNFAVGLYFIEYENIREKLETSSELCLWQNQFEKIKTNIKVLNLSSFSLIVFKFQFTIKKTFLMIIFHFFD